MSSNHLSWLVFTIAIPLASVAGCGEGSGGPSNGRADAGTDAGSVTPDQGSLDFGERPDMGSEMDAGTEDFYILSTDPENGATVRLSELPQRITVVFNQPIEDPQTSFLEVLVSRDADGPGPGPAVGDFVAPSIGQTPSTATIPLEGQNRGQGDFRVVLADFRSSDGLLVSEPPEGQPLELEFSVSP